MASAADQPTLDRWCDSVGPPLLLRGPEAASPVASLVIVGWNIHVGHADVGGLIEWLNREAKIPQPAAFVLLLQEAVRSGPAVPATVPSGMEPPGEIRTRADTQGVAAMAARLSLHAAYVPSMRNGSLFEPDAQQDRGNAILSTHPLSDVRAIELPFGGQRRVVVAATVAIPGLPAIGVATVHLNPRSNRAAEAKALAPQLREMGARGPLVAGGDLNTWNMRREQALKNLEAVLPQEACGRGKTNTWPRHMHVPFGWWRGRLDYVFSNLAASGLQSTCETIDRRFGSDHNPTVLVIPVPTNEQG